ncbi:unnamed protein product [Anisakis simplex]|uniref:Protein SDA1 n=1 Tax=Anisakis simplex TaxID=6269 RepID=A0A0M3J6H5_ANISI|nr:unnamed protein product [Anisakis simplex]
MVARRRIARSQSSKIKTKSAKKDKNLLEEEKQEERAEESDNSIDWADISMEEELLGDLLDYVKDAYDEVRKDEDKIINTEGLERYLWAHQQTPKRYQCKDEKKLSHMPFIGDGEVDDSSFGEELLETFAEGIHGTRTGCGEVINDNILYKLIKLLFVKHPDISSF